jgi:hypothetical protein
MHGITDHTSHVPIQHSQPSSRTAEASVNSKPTLVHSVAIAATMARKKAPKKVPSPKQATKRWTWKKDKGMVRTVGLLASAASIGIRI